VAIENAGSLQPTTSLPGRDIDRVRQVAAASVAVVQLRGWTNSKPAKHAAFEKRSGNGAYHLVTDQPVTVYQYNPLEYKIGSQYSYTADASLLLPVNTWTENYTVAARNTWYFTRYSTGILRDHREPRQHRGHAEPVNNWQMVVAGAGVAANGSGTITLNTGDVLQCFRHLER